MAAIRIVVDGAPVGKGRPRFVRTRRFGVAYTPEKTANYEAILAAAGAEAMSGRQPLNGPLVVIAKAFMPIAQSWSKTKTVEAITGVRRPGKPDVDNILKCIGDALNHIVWHDDSQIAEVHFSKWHSEDPRLEIEVAPISTVVHVGSDRSKDARPPQEQWGFL